MGAIVKRLWRQGGFPGLNTNYIGTPPSLNPSINATKDCFQALDNSARVFAIQPNHRVLMLTDPPLDSRVVGAVGGFAKARGATLSAHIAVSTTLTGVPEKVKPLIQSATFVVSTWFWSTLLPSQCAKPGCAG